MDRIELNKAKHFKGEFSPTPDKSISHRAVIISSLSKGESIIRNFLRAEDPMSTVNAFRSLGVDIKDKGDDVVVNGEEGIFFHEHLRQNGMPFGAFIVNRVHDYHQTSECKLLKDDIVAYLKSHNHHKLPTEFYEVMTSKITEICGYLKYLSTADQKVIDRLRGLSSNGRKAAVYTVPIFEYDIHDVAGLHNFSQFLFPQP